MAAGQGGMRMQPHWRGHKSDKVIVNPGWQSAWWSAPAGPYSSAASGMGRVQSVGAWAAPPAAWGHPRKEMPAPGLCVLHYSLSTLRASQGCIRNHGRLRSANRPASFKTFGVFLLSCSLSAAQLIMFTWEDPQHEAGAHCQAGLSCLGSTTW